MAAKKMNERLEKVKVWLSTQNDETENVDDIVSNLTKKSDFDIHSKPTLSILGEKLIKRYNLHNNKQFLESLERERSKYENQNK